MRVPCMFPAISNVKQNCPRFNSSTRCAIPGSLPVLPPYPTHGSKPPRYRMCDFSTISPPTRHACPGKDHGARTRQVRCPDVDGSAAGSTGRGLSVPGLSVCVGPHRMPGGKKAAVWPGVEASAPGARHGKRLTEPEFMVPGGATGSLDGAFVNEPAPGRAGSMSLLCREITLYTRHLTRKHGSKGRPVACRGITLRFAHAFPPGTEPENHIHGTARFHSAPAA